MNEEEKNVIALYRNMKSERPAELRFTASNDGETILWETVKKGRFKIGQFEAQQKQ